MKPLCVVIPSKTASNLVPCIAAVRKHEPDARIIVVDDGIVWPDQVELDRFRFIPQTVHFVAGEKPFIFSRNANIGIRAAGDSDVCLCNDDALLESPGGFSLMQKAAEEHPEVGIIGATTNLTGQPLQQRDRGPKAGLRIVPHIAFVCVMLPARTRERLAQFVGVVAEDPRAVIDDNGEQIGYDVKVKQVFSGGLLDERYCLDYGVEDRDYCEQINRAGLKVAVHDGCFVDHGKLVSSFRGDPKQPKSFARNYALFKAKWGIS